MTLIKVLFWKWKKTINSKLKGWAGVSLRVENGLLFRAKENFGLGITLIFDHFQRMQLIKCDLLQNSVDDSIRTLYKHREKLNSKCSRVWRATNVSKVINSEVTLNLCFPGQSDKLGLGFGNFNPNPSAEERRKMITNKAQSFSEQKRLNHSLTLKQQGVWLQWAEKALPFDFSWKNLIWSPFSKVARFVLNASVNWLKTPSLLKLWGLSETSSCFLCPSQQCTLHHILSNCPFALSSKRYTWRHDSILLCLKTPFEKQLSICNSEKWSFKTPHISKSFVPAGRKQTQRCAAKVCRKCDLDGSDDWKILIDFDGEQIVFPPEIISTSERPDIIIWSHASQKVLLIELTCPAEEGIDAAKIRKETKYMDLINQISEFTNWKVSFMTIEVGACGFVGKSIWNCLGKLGFSHSASTKICKSVSLVAAKCSYAIYLASKSRSWDAQRPLLACED